MEVHSNKCCSCSSPPRTLSLGFVPWMTTHNGLPAMWTSRAVWFRKPKMVSPETMAHTVKARDERVATMTRTYSTRNQCTRGISDATWLDCEMNMHALKSVAVVLRLARAELTGRHHIARNLADLSANVRAPQRIESRDRDKLPDPRQVVPMLIDGPGFHIEHNLSLNSVDMHTQHVHTCRGRPRCPSGFARCSNKTGSGH